jgi:hypothetical protein
MSTAQAKLVQGGVRDVARIQYSSCTGSIKPNSCNFVVINASRVIPLFSDFYTSQEQVSSAVWQLLKVAPYFTSVLLYFSGPSVSLMPALLSGES